jgi:hypothetical protein
VLTPNELAYKEKDNDDAEFKAVWKIPADVLGVEAPEEGSKDFGIVISENGTQRSVKLSAADAASAQKFASAVAEAIKIASAPKAIAASSIQPSTGAADLTMEDVKSSESTILEDPSAIGTLDESTVVVTDSESAGTSVVVTEMSTTDTPIPIEQQSKELTKPAVWFWGMCCAAE